MEQRTRDGGRMMKNEIQKTSKKTASSFAFWAIPAFLICCGGPIIFLALLSGGLTSFLGFFLTNSFLIFIGVFISLLAVAWLIAKPRMRKGKNG